MATTETTMKDSGQAMPESGSNAPAGPVNFFRVDMLLRVFLFALTVSALVVLVTSKQTELVPASLQQPSSLVARPLKFNYSPALIYLLVALCVTCLYSIVTVFGCFMFMLSPSPATSMLFHLLLMDMLMAGIMASAMGSAGTFVYIGLKGNSHTGWIKICDTYGTFCKHIGSSAFLSLGASIVLVLLAILSAYSFHCRSH